MKKPFEGRPSWRKTYIENRRILSFSEMEKLSKSCAICGSSTRLHIDHCHKTNVIRDRLCQNCNVGIGHFKDDPELLRKAIAYLEKHDANQEREAV
jgi:hypothetical protein